ncbi:MAG: deoxyribonuclease IV [Patescibacteria group bacterium]
MAIKHRGPYIGGHVSAAGGIYRAIENAMAIGAESIQMFGSSPRQWKVTQHSSEDIERFKQERKKAGIKAVYLHAPYLINLASPNAQSRAMSAGLLEGHFKIANAIEAEGLIFHIGSGKEMPREDAYPLVVSKLKEVLKKVSGKSLLVIENSAGGGETIGSRLEEVAHIMGLVDSSRLAMCFDTAHAFESGSVREYTPTSVKELAKKINDTVGLERLVAMHVNDSKTPYDSHRDRHENIGEGYLGKESFRALINNKDFQKPAWLLEVPGFDETGPDKKNIQILKSLIR